MRKTMLSHCRCNRSGSYDVWEVDTMATKSILKSIRVKDRRTAFRLVRALENAEKKGREPVATTRTFSDASREEIRKMFGAEE